MESEMKHILHYDDSTHLTTHQTGQVHAVNSSLAAAADWCSGNESSTASSTCDISDPNGHFNSTCKKQTGSC